ncbi:MAG: hypothetical protein OEV85_14325 [Candidatus Thorarchaeota archaeon]|nr:hypothetical protein [Candidatus Thorarchaeota archaeon]
METDFVDKEEYDKERVEEVTPKNTSDNDIADALRRTDHIVTDYPNGMTLGVKLESVPGTRGVHVDIVFVLDLRKAAFGKGGLAMRAAVLETVNRDLEKVLGDVGLAEFLQDHAILTPWGRVHLPLLRGMAKGSLSLMHETRTVYVITENAKPTRDLSWLTETGRIVTADQFMLIRQSDTRSKLPDLKKSVRGEKWQLLEIGLARGWYGVLALVSLAIALSTSVSILLTGSGSPLIPAIVSAISGLIGGWLLSCSRNSMSSFQETLATEREQLREIGDATRITQSIEENEDRLGLIADLNFVVSPLIATVGDAISCNDVNATVNIACSVLDECVRLAPKTTSSVSTIKGDDGLSKFIGLFEHLGGNIEETNLALAYVGLTGHVIKPLTFAEAVTYLTELNNSLYDIGALKPNIKEALDDRLNMIALKETMEEFDKELQSDADATRVTEPAISEDEYTDEIQSEKPASFESTDTIVENAELHDQILNASVDEPHSEESEITMEPEIAAEDQSAEMAIVGADIVVGRMKKRKGKSKEAAQLSLIDDFEYIPASSEVKEERGSAGA